MNAAFFLDVENLWMSICAARTDLNPAKALRLVLRELKRTMTRAGAQPTVLRAFGDYSHLHPVVRESVEAVGFDPVQVDAVPRKNSADIALVLDALECFLTDDSINVYVIIGGDRDYIPLISRLRRDLDVGVWVAAMEISIGSRTERYVEPGHIILLDGFLAPPSMVQAGSHGIHTSAR